MRHIAFGLFYLTLTIAAIAPVLHGDGQESVDFGTQDSERNIGDLICGPKCVQEMLRLYGKENEDIIRLVREIQWPEVRKGATLANVAQALEKRGIHTFAMSISPSARIVWQHPVIVHLNPKPGEEMGHFVVWLPESQGDTVRIWNMSVNIQQENERLWSKERSGAVLLTSPEPIRDPGKALKWVGLPFYDQMGGVLAWVVFAVGLVFVAKSFRLHRFFGWGKKEIAVKNDFLYHPSAKNVE